MTFAQTLQKLMDREGLTNYQMAKKLECHQTSVKNWLDGSKPQKLMMKKIADYFNVSVEYLTTGEQKENAPANTGKSASDDEIKFALFGTKDIDDDIYEQVKQFAKFARDSRKDK